MCCRGQRRRGRGIHSSSSWCVWFGCLSEQQQRLRSSFCLSSPAFIFPSSVSQSGWREAGGTELPPPPGIQRPAEAQASSNSSISIGSTCCTHSGHFSQTCNHLLGLFFLLCGLLYFAAALLGSLYSRTGSDGLYLALVCQPAILLNVRQVSLGKEAARNNMSLMLCRWEQNNFTMKLVG